MSINVEDQSPKQLIVPSTESSEQDLDDQIQLKESASDQIVPKQNSTFKDADHFVEEIPSNDNTDEKPLSSVRHDVAIPPNYEYTPLSHSADSFPSNPARTYPFKLDPFQQLSVQCLERHESVLVAAHTSAGKTVIAEYAIAMSLRDKQRVIYTSPIKALSNQKYREMQAEFKDVGLMTGDTTINPTASCLVMTTEILRSMLYRGSEVMREVAWIIFDEVHYMRDKSRGVVWEETMILLPDSVRFVFLSATIPNAKQFAEWICDLHEQPCHVVYTDYRPTPLQHYLFPAGGDGVYLAVDEKGKFREDNFQKALAALLDYDRNEAALGRSEVENGNDSAKRRKGSRDTRSAAFDLYKIINMIRTKNNLPVIIFSFSRKDCESHATKISRVDFNTEEEKDLVENVFVNALDSLSEEDRKLPQISSILPLLKRGIGIHHSGLLPILKEVIEILFQEGLLKVLFATETFSIGLNMPAKTVVFTNVRKFDGKAFRWVSGGEYIQMSGRAGRRGLDDKGIVILMLDERMEPAVALGMLKGNADPLNSAFHLSYNMILNLMRVEGIAPERMLEKSFYQFQNNQSLPMLQENLDALLKHRSEFPVIAEEIEIQSFYELKLELEHLSKDIKRIIYHPSYILPFVQPGRLVWVVDGEKDYGWGCIVALQKKTKGTKDGSTITNIDYMIDTLLFAERNVETGAFHPSSLAEMHVVPITINAINSVSTVRVHIPHDLNSVDNRKHVGKSIKEVIKRFSNVTANQSESLIHADSISSSDGTAHSNSATPDSKFQYSKLANEQPLNFLSSLLSNPQSILPLLDPIKDIGIVDDAFKKLTMKSELVKETLKTLPITSNPNLSVIYECYKNRIEIDEKIKAIRKKIQDTTAVIHMEELKCRKRVLRRLGFLSQEDVIEVKGRVACEISTGDELLLTEMIFNGVFNDLSVEECVSLLSCFVFEEKNNKDTFNGASDTLKNLYKLVTETATRIAKVSVESRLQLDPDIYIESFRPELMNVVYNWCKGSKFLEICKMTDVFEGSIIRCMKRLEELLRQMCLAAKSIGNVMLENKFSDGISKIKRDIVFSNSLYL